MTEKHANPFIDLLLTLILPSVVLESLSKPDRLGPAWALVVALLLRISDRARRPEVIAPSPDDAVTQVVRRL